MTEINPSKEKSASRQHPLVVRHKRLLAAEEDLLFQLYHGEGFELIVFVGPTGAGKTTLVKKVVAEILRREQDEMARDLDYVPIVMTTALASGYRGFDWKRLYKDAAKAVGDPFTDVRRPTGGPARHKYRIGREPLNVADFREAMEAEFKHRRTMFWFIDEATHILLGAKSGGIGDQFDVLKSIAQMRNVKIVLVGSYDLAAYIDCSGQLARRGSTVHLARYLLKESDDRKHFASAASTILKLYQLDHYPAVSANLDFYYAGCAGCVGILKDWCDRAVKRAQSEGRLRALVISDLQVTRLRKRALETIWRELLAGEALLIQGNDAEIGALETLMVAERLADAQRAAPEKTSTPNKRSKPGIPNPRRDPVAPVRKQVRG